MQVTRRSTVQIPESLLKKLLAYRERLWRVKLIEAFAGATIGVLVGFLLTYASDRLFDTPALFRMAILAASVIGCLSVPLALECWVWRRRRMDQLARLLTETYPTVGDQLLGVIELSESESEQSRSRALVEAAIRQVADDVGRRDLSGAIPKPRHRQRSWTAAGLGVAALLLLFVTASAAQNAWGRFLAPWKNIPRYTFAAVQPLPASKVVPHGEPFAMEVSLQGDSEWRPDRGEVRLPGRDAAEAPRDGQRYEFTLPPQITPAVAGVRVGDFRDRVAIDPKHRPELTSIRASIELPDYLRRSEPLDKPIRGSLITAVRGGRVTVAATASRPLESAWVNATARATDQATFRSEPVVAGDPAALKLRWRDVHGLGGKEAYEVIVEGVDDRPPALALEELPSRKVVLSTETLTFQIHATDDFGLRRVGYQWRGLDPDVADPAEGEKIVGAGNPEAERLDLTGTFSAETLGIDPQPLELRVFVEDYFPDRERVYSSPSVLHVLTPAEHAIWIANQLSRWHRMSLDVRDRELQLYDTNKQLRSLDSEALAETGVRRQLAAQASRERANGRRLKSLVRDGERLLAEAMRNPEIGVGHLDRWAEMMQILKDISGNRMPSVADLLKQASEKSRRGGSKTASKSKSAPQAGKNRLESGGSNPKKPSEDDTSKPPVPSIVDIESSFLEDEAGEPKEPSESKSKQGRLTLPLTMLKGKGGGGKKPDSDSDDEVDEAVEEQEDLLAEFDKIIDELNEVLANLEGSTLVKRLKAASRKQQEVATRLASTVPSSFGAYSYKLSKGGQGETFEKLAGVEQEQSEKASYIMDDMAAYFERSRYARFKTVLEDMREQRVIGALRELSEDLKRENGLSVALAEYWGETFDRWAEDLVEVSKCGACPGCKSKGSLPPSLVLEVLQVLEGEVKLREATREAQQARGAVTEEEHAATSRSLSETQVGFRDRIDDVVRRIRELPDAEADFGKEIKLLTTVSGVMSDAGEILGSGETGPPAIAAETEVIELLLQSKRFNPSGGGGGGSTPGGGGGGDTTAEALALVGTGLNPDEVREEMTATHAAGTAGRELPEEFRSGLNRYFNQIERWRGQ